ncbi:Protein of unknown function [Pyronema omphalodes CBS 100304]|uniref:Uncharacterized protein n=1 Tax=Pyronema omphalodes (strain CBS 100304) TaxID=1076935 RepID=U4LEE4_PYROM|nr:Protein of unknown function [Pyronema omphalodes CBS 100304]
MIFLIHRTEMLDITVSRVRCDTTTPYARTETLETVAMFDS